MPLNEFLCADDFATLCAAKDLPELMALAASMGDGAKLWALLRPADRNGQILLLTKGYGRLDPLPASQIAAINIPVGGGLALPTVPWARMLVGLLGYQCAWTGATKVVLPIWEMGSLVAIVGATAVHGGELPGQLVQGIDLSLRRLHQIAERNRNFDGAKYLLERAEKSVLLATGAGKILLGTAGGFAVLKRMQTKTRANTLPVVLRKAIGQGLRRVALEENIQAHLSCLPLDEPTTLSPLVSVRFAQKKKSDGRQPDLGTALESLTATELKVYGLLTKGLRDKEIADQLSVSYHTTKHHVAHILQKLRCSDRLLLMARAAQPIEPSALETPTHSTPVGNPKVASLPVVTPLPPAKYLRVPRRSHDTLDGAPTETGAASQGMRSGQKKHAGSVNLGD